MTIDFVTAASIIDRLGAYVGFFALIGLAILALLYFSQARDVRRLREWAGRAPERAAEAESRMVESERTGQAPVAAQPTVVRKAAPAAPGVGSSGLAGGSTAPATAAAKAAAGPGTPAGALGASGAAAVPATEEGVEAGSENGDDPAGDHEHRDQTGEHDELPAVLSESDQAIADQPTVAHNALDPIEPYADEVSEELEPLPPFEPLPSDESYLPGTSFRDAGERRKKPLHKRARNIHIPGGGATIAVLGGIVALIVLLSVTGVLGGGDDSSKSDSGSKQAQKSGKNSNKAAGAGQAASVDPAQVTVAVLNGTTTTGLANRVSLEAKSGGFQLGNVTNAATSDQAASEVLYAPGQKSAARAVADRLGISTIAPVDSVNAEIAGSADAVVLVGADRG